MTGHRHEIVQFQGSSGTLSGRLHIPSDTPRGGVVLSHCFTCSKSLKTTRQLATGLEDGGYAVLRYDFTGLGESEGDFTDTTMTTNVADIEAAARYMMQRGFGPCALVGHSLGGTATLLAATNVLEVRAVVAVAAPFRPNHVRQLFSEDDIDAALQVGRVNVRIAGRTFAISAQFFHDLEAHCTPENIASLDRPLLIVHGTEDRIVEIAEGELIFQAARQPRWFAAVPGADHLFTQPEHADGAAAAVVTFLETVL